MPPARLVALSFAVCVLGRSRRFARFAERHNEETTGRRENRIFVLARAPERPRFLLLFFSSPLHGPPVPPEFDDRPMRFDTAM